MLESLDRLFGASKKDEGAEELALLLIWFLLLGVLLVDEELGGRAVGGLSRRFLSLLWCLLLVDSFFALEVVHELVLAGVGPSIDIESESDGMPNEEEHGVGEGGPLKRRRFDEFPLLFASSSIRRLLLLLSSSMDTGWTWKTWVGGCWETVLFPKRWSWGEDC